MTTEEKMLDEAYRIYQLKWMLINGKALGDTYSGKTKSRFAAEDFRDPKCVLELFSKTNKINPPTPYATWIRAWIKEIKEDTNSIKEVSVKYLGLSDATVSRLKQNGLNKISDILPYSQNSLKRRIGSAAAAEVYDVLISYGLTREKNNAKKK